MRYKVSGEIAQQAIIELNANEWLWAANSSLVGYTGGVNWNLRIPGGFEGALKRSFAGEGISLTYVQSEEQSQRVLLSANQPGKIIEWDLQTDGPIVATRGAFLAAWGPDIDINVTVAKRAGAAFFGGAGLFLQKISGTGKVLVHGSGDFFQHHLREGEELTVSTGNLAAFAATVDYNIRGVGGCRKALFSGEGLFMTHLTGPGRILLQTLKRVIVPKSTSR